MKKNTRVLLTGGSGMVGRNILDHQSVCEWNVISPNRNELDLTDFDATIDYIIKIKPDIIVHAAGLVGGIHANISHPVDFLAVNLDISRNIIIAAYQSGVHNLINLGSSCMYPKNAPNPLKEDMILKGELEPTNEGYALAKIVALRLCEYIGRENKMFKYKTMIPCNIFGKYDKFDNKRSHLIPAIIDKIHSSIEKNCNNVKIWGDGSARREFMYASDLADAVFYALNNFNSMPSVVNIGMGSDNSINQYYNVVPKVMGYKGSFFHDYDKPTGMSQKLVSINKQTTWGWRPTHDLIEGIKLTYEYYLQEKKHEV